jgi:hypothetical protein
MRKVAPLCALLLLSCSQSKPPASEPAAAPVAHSSAAARTSESPATPTERTVTAEGEPSVLLIGAETVLFCDKRGPRKLDLNTGADTVGDQSCAKSEEANASCSGLPLDITVRAPPSEPNDIVDVAGSSFPLKGHVQDCAVDGKVLAVVTSSGVTVIDTVKGTPTQLDQVGGDRVAIGHSWVAWADGSKLHAAAISPNRSD